MPAFVADGLVAPIGIGANFANAERRAIVERHMRRVDPSLHGWALRQAVQGAFDSYTRYWIDCLRLPSLPARQVARGVHRSTGFDHVTDRSPTGGA